MKKIIKTTIIIASLGAGFLVAVTPADATPDGVVTVRVDDPTMGEYNVVWTISLQEELDLAADIDCHQLLTKDGCPALPNNCVCPEGMRDHLDILPDHAILVMDVDS